MGEKGEARETTHHDLDHHAPVRTCEAASAERVYQLRDDRPMCLNQSMLVMGFKGGDWFRGLGCRWGVKGSGYSR